MLWYGMVVNQKVRASSLLMMDAMDDVWSLPTVDNPDAALHPYLRSLSSQHQAKDDVSARKGCSGSRSSAMTRCRSKSRKHKSKSISSLINGEAAQNAKSNPKVLSHLLIHLFLYWFCQLTVLSPRSSSHRCYPNSDTYRTRRHLRFSMIYHHLFCA